jgi:hypothetical protein
MFQNVMKALVALRAIVFAASDAFCGDASFQSARAECAASRKIFRLLIQLACAGVPIVGPCVASADYQAWGPWSAPKFPSLVGAQFVHDDKGALTIICNTSTHLLSYILTDPRANWQKDTTRDVKVRADDGTETGPSHGHVLKADTLTVLEESTFDIHTMGKATTWFAIGDGVYARIFLAANFRKSMEPVLQACGDSW